jgi:hypothetical protein
VARCDEEARQLHVCKALAEAFEAPGEQAAAVSIEHLLPGDSEQARAQMPHAAHHMAYKHIAESCSP